MSSCGKLLQSGLVVLQTGIRKWRLTGHTVRKGDETIVEQALDWNKVGAKRRRRQKQTWKRTVLEEAGKCGKTWSEIRRLAGSGGGASHYSMLRMG